ncbi:MAG: hypothetical protein ACI9SY_000451 [Candidatus Paceibacteria bacterium]|jgi:hypothetical protein
MDKKSITIEVSNFSQALPHLRARIEVGEHYAQINDRTGYVPDAKLDEIAIAAAKKLAAAQRTTSDGK